MTELVKRWLGEGGRALRWIEFEAYAQRVFANATPDWYRDASKYAAGIMQAQGVVGSECLSIDLLAPFMARHPQARTAAEVVDALGDAEGFAFIEQGLGALLHRFEQRMDVFLKLVLPFDLLCDGDAGAVVDFNDLDDVATAMTALVRRLADRPLAGIVLEKRHGTAFSDDEIDAYEPLLSAARHYGWRTALAMPAARDAVPDTRTLDLDLLLLPQMPASALAQAGGGGVRLGGGLTDDFWTGSAEPGMGAVLHYGTIPADATPESVIANLRRLVA